MFAVGLRDCGGWGVRRVELLNIFSHYCTEQLYGMFKKFRVVS